MKNRVGYRIVVVICLSVLAACGSQAHPAPAPTDAPAPTAQPTPALGERQSVDAGGYSFRAPVGFETQIRAAQATISNADESILVSMATAPRKNDDQTAETVLAGFMENVGKDIQDLQAGQAFPARVGDVDGLAMNVTGTLFGKQNSGRIEVVDAGGSGFFIAFAFVIDGPDGQRWESEGSRIYESIVDSIEFFEKAAGSTGGSCAISGDPGYGYTREDPIRVGGDAFDGPPRERAYLDNLAGPNGERISYERTGSMDFGDSLLDAFVITGPGGQVTLYIDEYSYIEPQAPVGFTCLSAFTLTKP